MAFFHFEPVHQHHYLAMHMLQSYTDLQSAELWNPQCVDGPGSSMSLHQIKTKQSRITRTTWPNARPEESFVLLMVSTALSLRTRCHQLCRIASLFAIANLYSTRTCDPRHSEYRKTLVSILWSPFPGPLSQFSGITFGSKVNGSMVSQWFGFHPPFLTSTIYPTVTIVL